jgi:Fe2+ or Zn2+ uptake regulation protein
MPGQATKAVRSPERRIARRLPKNYALVREIVGQAGHGTHQTANDIYRRARELQPSIGFTTVHRGLARLSAMGEIMKVQLANADAAWYEPVSVAHAHLVCERCGGVSDVGYSTASRTLRSVAERSGVRIDAESITFRGLCRGCAGAKRGRRN